MLIDRADSYEAVYSQFRWRIPSQYNIADDVCDRWAGDAQREALVYEDGNGEIHRFTFAGIRDNANRLANALTGLGLVRGDRVIVLLAQHPEAAITHVACWKAGLVSCPTSVLFGPDAIAYRVNDSGARILVTTLAQFPKIEAIRAACPTLEQVLLIDGELPGGIALWPLIAQQSPAFDNVPTAAEDTAWISYTSGTTGQPKGAVHAHRAMLGHMPGIEFVYDFFPRPGDRLWSPADWAWLAGLMDVLMPGWFHGCTVIGTAMERFDAEAAWRILAVHEVTVSLLTPTVLKLMRQAEGARDPAPLALRVVASGAETVGRELLQWSAGALCPLVNEAYGQTECNVILGNNATVMPVKPGALGRAVPGATVAIVDDEGRELPPDTPGHIAVQRPHPVMMKGYLDRPDATAGKYIGDWLITGDTGTMDADGYFWFIGRADDIITSAGYRIGPGEIEDALLRHPAVQMAAVIGVPDPARTEIIKAFVVPAPGVEADDALVEALRRSVRERLARHEVPRLVEFVDSLPTTTTGKIMRRALRDRERARHEGRHGGDYSS